MIDALELTSYLHAGTPERGGAGGGGIAGGRGGESALIDKNSNPKEYMVQRLKSMNYG
jgi:hypothetical protein